MHLDAVLVCISCIVAYSHSVISAQAAPETATTRAERTLRATVGSISVRKSDGTAWSWSCTGCDAAGCAIIASNEDLYGTLPATIADLSCKSRITKLYDTPRCNTLHPPATSPLPHAVASR
jgi:hypothetical protein